MTTPSARAGASLAAVNVGRGLHPAVFRTPRAEYLYWALLVALIPLIYITFGDQQRLERRFRSTIEHAPANVVEYVEAMKQEYQVDDATLAAVAAHLDDGMYEALPEHRLEGALFTRQSWAHWLLAVLAAGTFFALLVSMFPLGSITRRQLLMVGLFTGTAGILLLLGFQFLADWTQDVWVRGRGILVLLFYVVKFIGFSYRAADDPSTGFLLSFVGYTFGVGMCEELCKIIPLWKHFNSDAGPSWRGACMWGLASGVGFGVCEGIMYSSRYYNGIHGADIYIVRFMSCVALHAVWTTAACLTLYKLRDKISDQESILSQAGTIVAIIIIPILLHGLYDTLLKKGNPGMALVTAVASFGFMAFLIERSRAQENAATAPPAAARVYATT
jgi:RsiW-degrading membrane proteinase PrsW (M82 family)